MDVEIRFVGARSVPVAFLPENATRSSRLTATIALWLADDRPAWETLDAFERDVERCLRGDMTIDGISRMPLRPRPDKLRRVMC